jgi:hypothetical protein
VKTRHHPDPLDRDRSTETAPEHATNPRTRISSDHLELAIANIQQLTIENDRLRRQTQAAAQIRHIPRSPLA